jgi:hypothetical protein
VEKNTSVKIKLPFATTHSTAQTVYDRQIRYYLTGSSIGNKHCRSLIKSKTLSAFIAKLL